MNSRLSLVFLLAVVASTSLCVTGSRAEFIADPNLLVGYSHGDWIDDAFSGMALSAQARNWASLGSNDYYYFRSGHVVLFEPTSGDPLLGWELNTVYAPWGVPAQVVSTSAWSGWGSHYHQHLFSADSVILRVDLDALTDSVWADISNPGSSSNNDIQITAYDESGVELGYQYGNIAGPAITRVQYDHPTADIKYFTVDLVGGFWGYPIHAVGAWEVPEPAALVLSVLGVLGIGFNRRKRP